MATARNTGRLIGCLTLAQIAGSFLVNFILAAPLVGPPGFLVAASAHAGQIAVSALCGVALGVLSLGIALAVYTAANERAKLFALCLFGLATASLAAVVFEQTNVMSMLSLSEAYSKAQPAEQVAFQGPRLLVAASRNWSHYLGLVMAGLTILAFYATLYRAAFLPPPLAAAGMAAAGVQLVAVSLPLFGHAIFFPLLAPLGVCQLISALWLMAKGFPDDASTRGGGDA